MEKPLKQTVFLKVSVEDRLPEKGEGVHVITNFDGRYGAFRYDTRDENDGKWNTQSLEQDYENITHWLEKQEDKYLLTEKELKFALQDAFQAGRNTSKKLNDFIRDYLNQK